MGRASRVDLAGEIYHIVNRSNGRAVIFRTEKDYFAFIKIIEEGLKTFEIELFAFEIMPNHWHLLISPLKDGEVARFIGWLTLTHTQRYHATKGTAGYGHVYQGRYKSFIIQKEGYFIRVCRYIERNALRVGLVPRAENWRWGSAWIREKGTQTKKAMLAPWPIERQKDYIESLNENDDSDEDKKELDLIRDSINRGRPLGAPMWVADKAKELGIETTLRARGRPRKVIL